MKLAIAYAIWIKNLIHYSAHFVPSVATLDVLSANLMGAKLLIVANLTPWFLSMAVVQGNSGMI